MADAGRVLLMGKGDYNSGVTYNALDFVRYNGASWVCKVDGTVNVTPASGANWQLLAQDGSSGGGGGSVNNAYKIVKVGSTNITASGEDTLELVAGSNVTLTPDASLKKVTIAASGGGGSTGDMLASDYDSDFAVKTAGGIKSYVTTAISGKADSASLATVATSGSYNDLSNKPTIPAAQVNSDWNASSGVAQILNKPTIPTVNNATLTIQQNGTTKATFTANSSSDATANITTDTWTGTESVTSSGTVTFTGLSDSYGYDLYCENKVVGITSMTKSGSGSSVSVTYTLSGAASGDVCKLRILK